MKHTEFQVEALCPPAKSQPAVVDAAALPFEGWEDHARGTGRWQTLFCADKTPTNDMVLGLAVFAAGDTLAPHRHSAPEFYLGVSGEGDVTIDGVVHKLKPGVAIFIPGNAEHDVLAGADGVTFAYGFATARFTDVGYQFSE